jgi:hypothetical protein
MVVSYIILKFVAFPFSFPSGDKKEMVPISGFFGWEVNSWESKSILISLVALLRGN